MLETASCRRFGELRGVQWRMDLGVLPSFSSVSVDDFRRVTADSRRRYAALRRQLLIDPLVRRDRSDSSGPVIDNPLSQNPDSKWGRFFRNAELERMVDRDLKRLYHERGSYFQTSECQGMLRRILLLWCLRYPEYGYRQGMHELLAPLLYVLHADLERLGEVKKNYEEHFVDKFDAFSFHDNNLTFKFEFKKFTECNDDDYKNGCARGRGYIELDPQIQTIISLSDAYGAEGELGIVTSEKYMEHDAYCMFDALMIGAGGAVVMADFFSHPTTGSSHTALSPVIEASAALYHLLSVTDLPLYSHLVELGVEPQYFGLRWLRVLFGREFSLENIVIIWDEMFTYENKKSHEAIDGILESPRGAFICTFAVSMILHLRSSLLATETATTCLQRLLNFPSDVDIVKLLAKAKSLHALAIDMSTSYPPPIHPGWSYDGACPSFSLSQDSTSPRTPLNMVTDCYWEKKWRVLHKEEKRDNEQSQRKSWHERVRLRLSRTHSVPSPSKETAITRSVKPSVVRRSLLDDLVRQLGFDDNDDTDYGDSDSENESKRNTSVASNLSVDADDVDSGSGTMEESCLPISDLPEESCLPISDLPDSNSVEYAEIDNAVQKEETCSKGKRPMFAKIQRLWKFGRSGGNEKIHAEEKASNSGISSVDGDDPSSSMVEQHSMVGDDPSSSMVEQHSVVGDDPSSSTVEQHSMVNLKTLSQSILENIQVIESAFQKETMEKGQTKAMEALKELRKISKLLMQM